MLKGTQQAGTSLAFMYWLIEKERPSQIIELGTGFGTFTKELADLVPECNIYTFDVVDRREGTGVSFDNYGKRVQFHVHGVFSDGGEKVAGLIQKPGKSLVLCDNGDKPREFNTFWKYLKTNDIIAIHDYAPSKEWFEKYVHGKYWNHCECVYEDLDPEAFASRSGITKHPLYVAGLLAAWGVFHKYSEFFVNIQF